MELNSNQLVSHREEVLFADLDGNVAMMNVESGAYYDFDEVASFIWRNIEQPIVISELCKRLLDEFDVDADECSAQTMEFLGELSKLDLINVSEATA